MSIQVTVSSTKGQFLSVESNQENIAVNNGVKFQVITPKSEAGNKKWLYAAATTVATVTTIGLAVFAYYRSISIQPFCLPEDILLSSDYNNAFCPIFFNASSPITKDTLTLTSFLKGFCS